MIYKKLLTEQKLSYTQTSKEAQAWNTSWQEHKEEQTMYTPAGSKQSRNKPKNLLQQIPETQEFYTRLAENAGISWNVPLQALNLTSPGKKVFLVFIAASSSWSISYRLTVFWGGSRGNLPVSRLRVQTILPPRSWICNRQDCGQIRTFQVPWRREVRLPVQSHQHLLVCCSNVGSVICSTLEICTFTSAMFWSTLALASGIAPSMGSAVSLLGSLSWTMSVDFSWSKNRHTTAQSSLLDVGNFNLQDLTAQSTRALAAVARDGAEATISTASLFERTSQTYSHFSF